MQESKQKYTKGIYLVKMVKTTLSNAFSALKCLNIYVQNKISHIMKTRFHNFDPIKPHFYIVKLGFTNTLFFLFWEKKKK